ncbi:MAG: dTDP-4-dehydrorhamnose 3,5-epimerase family protein [Acidimicrobiales bacterium]|nr:dTDP-4-dehydrorhamnose 3,5-epimerase family protein [Acidimicrobiales bacterium]
MDFQATRVSGCFVVTLDAILDDRGYFSRAWCAEEFAKVGAAATVAQINMSQSVDPGLIRGFHWQEAPHGEEKFVRCIRGAVFDVCADVRPDSPTFGQWFGIELNPRNRLALVIPEGCAHAYQALEPESEVLYLTSAPYTASAERGMQWDDPFFAVEWPLPGEVEVSEKDRSWPQFGVG